MHDLRRRNQMADERINLHTVAEQAKSFVLKLRIKIADTKR